MKRGTMVPLTGGIGVTSSLGIGSSYLSRGQGVRTLWQWRTGSSLVETWYPLHGHTGKKAGDAHYHSRSGVHLVFPQMGVRPPPSWGSRRFWQTIYGVPLRP